QSNHPPHPMAAPVAPALPPPPRALVPPSIPNPASEFAQSNPLFSPRCRYRQEKPPAFPPPSRSAEPDPAPPKHPSPVTAVRLLFPSLPPFVPRALPNPLLDPPTDLDAPPPFSGNLRTKRAPRPTRPSTDD